MKALSFAKFFVILCLSCASTAASVRVSELPNRDVSPTSQIQFATIIVNGRTLTGPNTGASRRNGRILIPAAAVARALGDQLSVDIAASKIAVRRQSGLVAEFDARLGRVSENGSLVLMVTSSGVIIFSPNTDDIQLPVEIIAGLFDVAIRYDETKKAVVITRGQTAVQSAATNNGRKFADLYQADYEYDFNKYSATASQNLVFNAIGRLADGRFNFTSNSSSNGIRDLKVRNVLFALERPNGQRYRAGDFGIGSDLEFLSGNVRGGSASIPVSSAAVTAFAGITNSGVIVPDADPIFPDVPVPTVRNRYSYDTKVLGVFASTASKSGGRQPNPFTVSAGAMRFSSSNRSGDVISGSVNYNTTRLRLEGDVGFGKFSRLQGVSSRTSSTSIAVDLAGTFQMSETLAFQARYVHIGENFLSPQAGLREPVDLKAIGVTWSPTKWLSSSFNASTSSRPGNAFQKSRFVTAAFALSPNAGMPKFYFSHTQSGTSETRSTAFTLLNASKEFSRLRLFMNATRTKTIGPASVNAQIGANYAVNDRNSIEVTHGIGSGGTLNGQFDWRTSDLLHHRLSLTAGGGYSRSRTSGISPYERLTASLILPRQTSVQVSYFQTNAGPTVMVSVRGTLFHKREAQAFLDSPASSMNSYGKVSGRVYQDIDLNGRFDQGVDKPQAAVKVRVDGNRYVESDENGLYSFESVNAGNHKVSLDLLSVRADLTLLGGSAQESTIAPGDSSVYDFRLVRTGRLAGRVWLDTNENGQFDDGETPLADIRVVSASGRDTLTDSDGNFTIGDLPPGEHVILLDEKTLPEKTIAGVKPVAVQVFPGRETPDIALAVINLPAEIRRFTSKRPQE
ncbi:hypothetical protein BH10ACI3_BH10ACI3_20560 [soil metagenome]